MKFINVNTFSMISVLLCELIRILVQFIADKTVQRISISHSGCTVHLFNLNDTELANSDPVKHVIGL